MTDKATAYLKRIAESLERIAALKEAETALQAADAGPDLDELRRTGSGFLLDIFQNRGLPYRVKRYGFFRTVVKAASTEVLRSAVDRLDVRHRETGAIVACLTRGTKVANNGVKEATAILTEFANGAEAQAFIAEAPGPSPIP